MVGSFINMMLSNVKGAEPQVGMGVTEICWSDRHPWEITAVKDDRHITVRKLDFKRVDDYGMSDSQEYEYFSNEENYSINLFKDRKGVWRERMGKNGLGCTRFVVGYAEEYYDYSF